MAEASKIWEDVQHIRERGPLVHNITNYVVMNNTANALLAIGASPVMAHAVEEVEDMVGIAAAVSGALVINIGTLSEKWIEAMSIAMRAAAAKNVPIVFDPVGAGATPYRIETCKRLLQETSPSVIRGNASEIMSLLDDTVETKGVDSLASTNMALKSAQALAKQYKCVVSVSGKVDVITNGKQVMHIRNGHHLMDKVTGMGCTASAITGAFCAVNETPLWAATHAMAVMGLAGEFAARKADGPGTLQLHFYDALYTMSFEQIERDVK